MFHNHHKQDGMCDIFELAFNFSKIFTTVELSTISVSMEYQQLPILCKPIYQKQLSAEPLPGVIL